jgi:hypothetical protein
VKKIQSRVSQAVVEAIQAEGKARMGAKDGEMGAAEEKVEVVEVMVVDTHKLDELLALENLRRNCTLPNQ